MGHKSSCDGPLSLLERLTVVLFGTYLAGVGLNVLTNGNMLYRNYLRTPVLAPVALVIGAVLIWGGMAHRH